MYIKVNDDDLDASIGAKRVSLPVFFVGMVPKTFPAVFVHTHGSFYLGVGFSHLAFLVAG
jgi:hypothetical protein